MIKSTTASIKATLQQEKLKKNKKDTNFDGIPARFSDWRPGEIRCPFYFLQLKAEDYLSKSFVKKAILKLLTNSNPKSFVKKVILKLLTNSNPKRFIKKATN